MADEQDELRRINWQEVFSFSHIFKSFRLAIHPSKIVLAVAGIVLIYLAGSVLDGLAGWCGARTQGPQEIVNHATWSEARYDQWVQRWQEARRSSSADLLVATSKERHDLRNAESLLGLCGPSSRHFLDAFKTVRTRYNEDKEKNYQAPDKDALLKEDRGWRDLLAEANDQADAQAEKLATLIDQAGQEAAKLVKDDETLKNDEEKAGKARKDLADHTDAAKAVVTKIKRDLDEEVRKIAGEGIFSTLARYELSCLRNAMSAVVQRRIADGLVEYHEMRRQRVAEPLLLSPAGGAPPLAGRGVLFWVLMGAHGFGWLIAAHWFYAILLAAVTLAVVALCGGAISRIAALHFAREEKISIRQAIRFSLSKFLSFYTAPLIPLGVILVLGALLMLGALALNVAYLGPMLVGLLFLLAVAVGLIIAFLLIGLFGGAGLMYPTIAVEGSDSFDAISRSFSYIFARPWRAGLYTLVATFHGTVCYLFVRLFAFLTLKSAHCFAKVTVWTGGETLSPSADRVDVLWPAPTFDALVPPFNWAAMDNWAETAGAGLIWIVVALVGATVLGFLVSYAISSCTVIYYLLRQKVDATDLDDVYVEEETEEQPAGFVEAETAAEEAATPAEGDEQPPAEGEPGGQEPEGDSTEGDEPEQE